MGSPHIFSAALLHLTLIISLTCGSCPLTRQREDRHQETGGASCFLTTGSLHREKQALPPLQLVSAIRPVKHAYPKRQTQLQSISSILRDLQKRLLFLLKVCHIFLIIFTGIHGRADPTGCGNANSWRGNVSDAFPWENQG